METPRTENAVLVREARQAAGPAVLETVDGGQLAVFHTPDGIETIDLGADTYARRAAAPRRKTGTAVVHDVESFAEYYRKHSDEHSETYADLDEGVITAVLDANTPDGPRWGEHRVSLVLHETEAWKRWTATDRQYLPQVEFAEFIEDNLGDIADKPVPAAAMLEIARTFQAKTSVAFSSGVVAASGDITLTYEETTAATGGGRAKIPIPRAFAIGVAPFDDVAPYRVEARFRHRIRDNRLYLAYLLDRPADVVRDAVRTVVAKVVEATGAQIMRGAPPS